MQVVCNACLTNPLNLKHALQTTSFCKYLLHEATSSTLHYDATLKVAPSRAFILIHVCACHHILGSCRALVEQDGCQSALITQSVRPGGARKKCTCCALHVCVCICSTNVHISTPVSLNVIFLFFYLFYFILFILFYFILF